MTDVIVSFDSEDYFTPEAADAEGWWARELTQRKIRGCYQLVGEFVRSLHQTGRTDVIEALAQHEIDFHTDYHSLPPTHPEAVEHLSLADGIEYVLRAEAPGLATLATTFKQWPVSYCSPGDSWTPATLLAMSRMGLNVFCNDKILKPRRTPYWYCGLLVAQYSFDFQTYYEESRFQPGAFERAFDTLVESTPSDGVIILYTHPTRLVTTAFWDEVFRDGKRPALKDCPPAPLRSKKEIAALQDRCRGWLDWMAQRSDLRFIDYATLYKERAASRRSLQHLLTEESLKPGEEGLLPLRTSNAEAFLPSSTFDSMSYHWIPYPPGFEGKTLIQQARQLAWTAAPATMDPKFASSKKRVRAQN